ncbi:hypothetical protein ACXR2W_01000 [Leucobacter sp. HY1908]
MSTTAWIAYMEDARGDDSDARTAARLGLSQSAITRWRAGTKPRPQQVVDLARLYNANALTGLIAAGYLNSADLAELGTTVEAPIDLSNVNTSALIDELQRRLEQLREAFDGISSNDRDVVTEIVTELIDSHLPKSNVVRLDDHRDNLTPEETQALLQLSHAAHNQDGRDTEAEANPHP